MRNTMRTLLAAGTAALMIAGCGQGGSGSAETAGTEGAGAAEGLAALVATGLPAQAVDVAAAKRDTADGTDVVLVGRVKDFVDGVSVLTLADEALEDCSRKPDDHCPTPWDYCCVPPDQLAAGLATVKLVAAHGEPFMAGLKGVNGIDHLKQVAAEGKAVRDENGNLIVEATRLYVMP